ncbi:MAG: histidine kinase [Bacteroidetes bacterium]|nr:histidine kinase [Bacteroidota bacterium]
MNGQQYSYVHYDVKDGLPSKRVYAMCQDKNGFIWFATDNGVCRFDGSDFKVFTTENGLPDNDIINVFCDSKNRVWFTPFKREIAYYYQGRIYNRNNDTLLRKIYINSTPIKTLEDKEGTVWIFQECGLSYITRKNECGNFEKTTMTEQEMCSLADIFLLPSGEIKGIFLLLGNNEYQAEYSVATLNKEIDKKKSSIWLNTMAGISRNRLFLNSKMLVYPNLTGQMVIRNLHTGKESKINTFPTLNTMYEFEDTAIMFNTGDGVWCYNADGKLINRFLEGKTIGRSFVDEEGNKWYTSLDDGVYKLGSEKVFHLGFSPPQPGNTEVFSIGKQGDIMLAGLNSGMVARIDPEKKISYFYKDNIPGKRFDRVLQIINLPNKEVLFRSDKGFVILNQDLSLKTLDYSSYKSLFVHKNRIYAGTIQNARYYEIYRPEKPTIFLKERTTAILETNGSIYNGALNDLFLVTPDKKIISLGERFPELKTKITTIDRSVDGTIWVGTYSSGLMVLKNNQLIARISAKEGLTSNNCRTTCMSGNNFWVGTDRGLNKIEITKTGFPVTRYTTADGLPADIINAIYAENGKIYTGTSEGLSWFNENNIPEKTTCNILLDQVTVNGIEQEIKDRYSFSHRQQTIFFHFTAISHKAAGNIVYTYRLKGLENEWQETQQQSLNFISLPSGTYTFELYATNKAGVKSKLISIPFTINTPYWLTDWFKLLVLFFIVAISWFIINRRIQSIRKKEAEKNQIRQQIFELEQKAKRAQMNPHFIFNCISSIQHFIFSNELEACNDYLARFARLIRQTLDNSEKTAIQLSEEIKYLDNYLGLEQMRFAGRFTYKIILSPSIHADFLYLPAMLLQPYVENSIRHGVRNRRDNKGLITISFNVENDALICTIEDNGIGRKMAETMKSGSHIEYQSKGMSLTSDRINAINQSYGEQTDISIIDLTEEDGQSTGTRIEIRFPFSLLNKLN